MFKNLLPDLTGKCLLGLAKLLLFWIKLNEHFLLFLDIGSRFGAVLFGAFVYSQASNISGVELNADLSSLSKVMVQRYNMQVKYIYFFIPINKLFLSDNF